MPDTLHKIPNESETSMIWRLDRAKQSGEIDITWTDIATIIEAAVKPPPWAWGTS